MRQFFRILPLGGSNWLVTGCAGLAFNKRGATSLLFAVCLIVILGFIGLATEAGTWYLARMQLGNAADAAAIAGALAASTSSDPQAAADAVFSQNEPIVGAASVASLVVNSTTPDSGPYAAASGYAEVVASATFNPLLSAFFGLGAITMSARSVATVAPASIKTGVAQTACAVSLGGAANGSLVINQGLTTFVQGGSNCYFASNGTGSSAETAAIQVTSDSSAYFDVYGFISSGDCPTCPSFPTGNMLTGWYQPNPPGTPGPEIGRPTAAYQPPTTDPFGSGLTTLGGALTNAMVTCPKVAGMDPSIILGTNNCPVTAPSTSITVTNLVPSSGDGTTCNPSGGIVCAYYNMPIKVESSITLAPGTYLFVNSSLDIESGSLTCEDPQAISGVCGGSYITSNAPTNSGVTMVFTGTSSDVGNLTIRPTAGVILNAPNINTYSTALNGILFYRDAAGSPGSAYAPAVDIADTYSNINNPSATALSGIMYFPNAYVAFAANKGTTPLSCSIILAGNLTLGFSGALQAGGIYLDATENLYQAQIQLGSTCPLTTLPTIQAAQVVE